MSVMPFTQEQKEKIEAAIAAKLPAGTLVCPVCHTPRWSLGDGVVRLTLQPNPAMLALAGSSFPLIPIICNNCGNTQLLNAFVLGVGEALGIRPGVPAVLPTGAETRNG